MQTLVTVAALMARLEDIQASEDDKQNASLLGYSEDAPMRNTGDQMPPGMARFIGALPFRVKFDPGYQVPHTHFDPTEVHMLTVDQFKDDVALWHGLIHECSHALHREVNPLQVIHSAFLSAMFGAPAGLRWS